jgi:hypothetical protein
VWAARKDKQTGRLPPWEPPHRKTRADRRQRRTIPVRSCARSHVCGGSLHHRGGRSLSALPSPDRVPWRMWRSCNHRDHQRWTRWHWIISAAPRHSRRHRRGRRRYSASPSRGGPDPAPPRDVRAARVVSAPLPRMRPDSGLSQACRPQPRKRPNRHPCDTGRHWP